jgi:diguanylate cyclase (GGDEF)-like protein/PAS domain S-box-containing protein
MIELYCFALNSIDLGIIIIDSDRIIRFWNNYIEKISQIKSEEAVGRKLGDICETFSKTRYQDIMNGVFSQNMSRFCSSRLHKAFVYPKSGKIDMIRQNMTIEPTCVDGETYAVIQINDITNQVNNEYSLTSLINELRRDYDEIKGSEEYNKQLAEIDSLTKTANRHAITAYIDSIFTQGNNIDGNALLFLDLDGFKNINDTYGHLMGDNLLISVANRIKSKLRKGDIVARLGGDEFLVLLTNVRTYEDVAAVGTKLLEEISNPTVINGTEIKVTVSIGISMFGKDIHNTKDFIRTADEAMYNAKRGGKNRFVIY